jgi:hypothetical protein
MVDCLVYYFSIGGWGPTPLATTNKEGDDPEPWEVFLDIQEYKYSLVFTTSELRDECLYRSVVSIWEISLDTPAHRIRSLAEQLIMWYMQDGRKEGEKPEFMELGGTILHHVA